MDELLKTLIQGAPNVAVALGALFWAGRMLERQQAATERLIDRLMQMLDKNEKLQEQLNSEKSTNVLNKR